LLAYSDVFNETEFDIGKADFEHDIELTPGPAVRERPRPIPPQDLEEVRQHIKELLEANIIKPSTSPFASPIVLVRKKNGALRMCIDYRRINARTVRDSYALPKIEDLFKTLGGAKFFTSVDLSKAYYQVPLSERAKKISAFTTPFGLFEFERLSFGMVNGPMTFQKLMEQCFRDMNLAELIIFLDDILIHAENLEMLEERTIKVLDRLRRHNLKLDPDKCVFCAKEVKHLGYLISGEGIKPDPGKTEALTSWPVPTTVREVKAFIGFAGYYRRFVSHFSQLVKPLNDLTAGYIPHGSQKKGGKKGTLTLSSTITHLWGDKQQQAFDDVKKALTSEPVLGIVDKTKPFMLHCDASGTGLGAVLYQEQEDGIKVIAYASRGLNKTEANYPAHKREFLALKWSMTDKFHDYLIGAKVTVVTDNNPLCYVLKNAKLDATSHRWLAALSIYDFDLKYKKGSTHTDADGLSRRPQPSPEEDVEYQEVLQKTEFILRRARQFDASLSENAVSAILTAKGVSRPVNCCSQTTVDRCQSRAEKKQNAWSQIGTANFVPAVEQLVADPESIPDDILQTPTPEGLISITIPEWRKLQLADQDIRTVIQQVEAGRRLMLDMLPKVTPDMKVFEREQSKMVMKEGVLHRQVNDENGGVHWQLVIPRSKREEAMRGVHEDLYHINVDSALRQARLRFFWPFMARDLDLRIKNCSRCILKGAVAQKAPMQSIVTTYPFELLSIDFLTIEYRGGKKNILVVMDHFTKFAVAIPTKNQLAKSVADALWKNVFMMYGFPKRILSDQGRDFESVLISELCKMAGIQKCRTTPYHPSGNPVERWNRTLIGMLRGLESEEKVDWMRRLPAVVHAYNTCVHSSTGYSPYYLFFGRHPRLPVDLAFNIDLNGKPVQSSRKYIQELKKSLKSAYTKAKTAMEHSAGKNKARYDARAHAAELEPGDRVLVRRMGPKLSSKICDRWETEIHLVISKMEDAPVYTVQREDGEGPVRTLHRNLLLPIGALEVTDEPKETKPVPVPRHRSQRRLSQTTQPPRGEEDDEDEEQEQSRWTVKVQMTPKTQLRSEAPEFVPRTTPRTIDESVDNTETVSERGEEEKDTEAVTNDDDDYDDDAVLQPSVIDNTDTASECGEAASDDDEVIDDHEDNNTALKPQPAIRRSDRIRSRRLESDPKSEQTVRPIPTVRKSSRIRKPVDRLSLLIQALDYKPEERLSLLMQALDYFSGMPGVNEPSTGLI
jgi:transposase InsO family protein